MQLCLDLWSAGDIIPSQSQTTPARSRTVCSPLSEPYMVPVACGPPLGSFLLLLVIDLRNSNIIARSLICQL